jgi:ParD-like antitoxin of type II ParDE toxin-antitoxin system
MMWQLPHRIPTMAKSIRITDDLYRLAAHEARLMDRSLAQQIEHWVKLGVGVERNAGATLDDVRSAALLFEKHKTKRPCVQA